MFQLRIAFMLRKEVGSMERKVDLAYAQHLPPWFFEGRPSFFTCNKSAQDKIWLIFRVARIVEVYGIPGHCFEQFYAGTQVPAWSFWGGENVGTAKAMPCYKAFCGGASGLLPHPSRTERAKNGVPSELWQGCCGESNCGSFGMRSPVPESEGPGAPAVTKMD